MARITITLSEEKHRAIKEAAARQGKTIGEIIDESLDFYGIKSVKSAAALVAKARQKACLTEDEARKLAVEETRAEREG